MNLIILYCLLKMRKSVTAKTSVYRHPQGLHVNFCKV